MKVLNALNVMYSVQIINSMILWYNVFPEIIHGYVHFSIIDRNSTKEESEPDLIVHMVVYMSSMFKPV